MENLQAMEIVAWISVFISLGMALFQLMLALGAPFGNLAWGGKYKILPLSLRFGSFISVILFIIAGISVAEKADIIIILNQDELVTALVWFFVILFGLSTIGNITSKSKWEKRIMTPIAFSIFLLCLIIVLGT